MPLLVSIVVPVYNDADTLGATLASCLAQTLPEVEVVCVDDASTDGSARIVEEFAARDQRVRLIRQPRNLSAFQARRAGVLAARSDHVLFVDGDDELAPNAAAAALKRAREAEADIVGFGVTVIGLDGHTGGRYEQKLQPTHRSLSGTDVLRRLFPIDEPAQGQLWRYLFRTSLVRAAYALMPDDLVLTRVNDLPLMFLIAALASSYASTPERLYRYHLGRGGSGHRVDSAERAEFYAGAISSIDSIADSVQDLRATVADAALLRETYASVRAWIVAYVCSQIVGRSDSTVLDDALAHLFEHASLADVVHASARFIPQNLDTLRFHMRWEDLGERPVQHVLLATSVLRTGGVTAVLVAQAGYLRDAGMRVTIAARKPGSDRALVPVGVDFVELRGEGPPSMLRSWAEICRERGVDVVIDHQVLYTPHWPQYALLTRAEGAATIAWVHNFVGRPVYEGTDRLALLEQCSALLARIVVLSPLDVAYFKLRGVPHALHAPNPPSPLLLGAPAAPLRTAPGQRVELVWWGRLEERTKKISELLDVAAHLRALGVDFRLTIIGPEWEGLTPDAVNRQARRRRLADCVVAVGPLHGLELVRAIDAADAFVSTSIIEGYQLTIAEAQSRGLPVFMYDLHWLTLVRDNPGIVQVPQGDSLALAQRIAETVQDHGSYARLSSAAALAARRVHEPDFGELYAAIVRGSVPTGASPEPTTDDARDLLGLMLFYASRVPHRTAPTGSVTAPLRRRLWRAAEPAGRVLLRRFPGLRPLARRARRWVGRR